MLRIGCNISALINRIVENPESDKIPYRGESSIKTKKPPYVVRPPTAILTRGFDPQLSVGSARPAVFRSSTYVFSSPESAERAFAIALGHQQPMDGKAST